MAGPNVHEYIGAVRRQPGLASVFLTAIMGLALSFFMLTKIDPDKGIPERDRLTSASGLVTSHETVHHDVHFTLQDGRRFTYLGKAKAVGAIGEAHQRVVTILYDASNTVGPVFSKEKFFPVYEIRVGDELVRSHQDVDQAWRRDNRLAPVLGWGFLGMSVLLLAHGARRLRQRGA